jgi:predicted ester cyclase
MTPTQVVELYFRDVLEGVRPESVAMLVASNDLQQRSLALRSAFPDLEIERVVQLADGDLVAGHFRARGTHRGLFQGVPATGRGWQAAFTAVLQVESDRLVNAWITWDTLSLMEQLGAIERVSTVSA